MKDTYLELGNKHDNWVIWDKKSNFIKFVLVSSLLIAILRLFLKFSATELPMSETFLFILKEIPEETLEALYNLALLLTPFYLFVKKLREFNKWLKYSFIFIISVIAISIEKMLDYIFPIIDFGYDHTTLIHKNHYIFYYIGDIFFYFIILLLFGYLDSILLEKKKIFRALLRKDIEVNELEMLKVKFELKSLQSQVNPHVLFNTLNSLSTLIVKNPQLAQDLTINMANLYRYILGASKKESWLIKEEIDLIRVYLDIESVRLGSRLTYQVNTTKKNEQMLIPPLLIQPLVENSIKYGIAPYVKGGTISINIIDIDNNICIIVKDTHSIKDNISSEIFTAGEKTGFENIKKRLNLVYDDNNASFKFKLNKDGASSEILIKYFYK